MPAAAVQTLSDTQMPNGGWEWMETFGTDTNTTSLAIQALIGTGQSITSTEVISGLAFLKSAQNADGGFTYDPAFEPYRQRHQFDSLLDPGDLGCGPEPHGAGLDIGRRQDTHRLSVGSAIVGRQF